MAELILRYGAGELGSVVERARIFPHLVGDQQRNPGLSAALRAGVDTLRGTFERLARAAQERGELDPAIDPVAFSRLPIPLLQGMMLQLGVYGDEFDVEAYARAAELLLDGPDAADHVPR